MLVLSSQEVNALIQTLTLREIHEVFKQTYPLERLSLTSFKRLKPWNLIKAYRETCLCRLCELFRLYMEGLHEVAKLLAPLLEVRWPALPAIFPFTAHLLLPPPPSPGALMPPPAFPALPSCPVSLINDLHPAACA